jgi:hypothetical protein
VIAGGDGVTPDAGKTAHALMALAATALNKQVELSPETRLGIGQAVMSLQQRLPPAVVQAAWGSMDAESQACVAGLAQQAVAAATGAGHGGAGAQPVGNA